jgi:GT2 family glycosyltransferase
MSSVSSFKTLGEIADAPVCAVTVTYGERLPLLAETLRGVAAAGASAVVVAGNGISRGYSAALAAFAEHFPIPLHIVTLPENLGSAPGFAAALRAAVKETQCPFFWLLDDDNLPAPDALTALREACRDIVADASETWASENWALCSLREDRPNYRKAAATGDMAGAFPPRGHVMGFDWRRAPRQFVRRLGGRRAASPAPAGSRAALPIPWAPYGGLFLHRGVLEAIGYPDEALRLYGDDTEFTNRIVRSGGRLLLVPGSRVADIEPSWTEGEKPQRFYVARLLAGRSPRRLYLSVRNDVFFTSRYWCDSRLRLLLNAAGFVALTLSTGLLTGRVAPALLVWRALCDGLAGRLEGDVPAA